MKKIWKVLLVLVILISLGAVYVIHCQEHLILTEYDINADIDQQTRIVQLTDLHNHEFGKENSKLIKMVNDQKPDLIVMTGDMNNEDDPNLEIVCHLIEELTKTAPVYFSIGNHEKDWMFDGDLEQAVKDAGAVLVDNSYEDITINGTDFRIGGYYGYYGVPHMKKLNEEETAAEMAFFKDFENTDRYKILLSHIPTAFVDWKYMDQYPIDLIFTGHYHGGQIRIPFVGGLVAPYVGWFPKNTKGAYTGQYGTCILSTGLGSEMKLPRINNDPEVILAVLRAQH